MSRHFEKDLFFDQPLDVLLALFTDPRFLEAEAVMQGQLRCTCVVVERTTTRLVLRLDQVGPNRIPGGRPKEVESALHYTWDLSAHSCRWHRDSPHEKGVGVAGAHSLFPTPAGGTRYHMAWDLEIQIPVLGRVLERQAEPAILEGADRRAAFARRWLAEGKLSG
jgi:hypothetical protein